MIATGLTPVNVDTELNRAVAYQTLAWSMVYPTAERLARMREWQTSFEETFAQLGLPTAEVTSALDLLPKDQNDRLQTLQVEYTRLRIYTDPANRVKLSQDAMDVLALPVLEPCRPVLI